jgi:hypothetical protein
MHLLLRVALLSAGGWTPVFAAHHLPTTLRSLSFADVQFTDAQVFFRGRDVRNCLSLRHPRAFFRFAQHLPASVRHLRVMCAANVVVQALEVLKCCSGLKELDLDVAQGPWFRRPQESHTTPLARALAPLSLGRLGLHASSGCMSLYIPNPGIAQLHCTFFITAWAPTQPLEDQLDHKSRGCITKLTLHVGQISACPPFLGCSALKKLVIGDCFWEFGEASPTPFLLKGLETVAGTLKHLTVSTNRGETCVELPGALRLQTFVCVCSGTLLLHCDADMLSQGLGDVLLGYTTIAGSGAKLVEELSPRLGTAQLEVLGPQRLKQGLMFTRPGLVGEWWYGVFQPSKQHQAAASFCCRVQVWAQGCLCLPYLTFLRYGIVSAHQDREVLHGLLDRGRGGKLSTCELPSWHSSKYGWS